MTIPEAVCAAAHRYPCRVAVQVGDDAVTYAELHQRSLRAAGAVCRSGQQQGQRVLLTGWNGPDLPAALPGVIAAGRMPMGTCTWSDG